MSSMNKKREVCNYCHSYLDEDIYSHRENCQSYKSAMRKSSNDKKDKQHDRDHINSPFTKVDGNVLKTHKKEDKDNYYSLNEAAITFGGKQNLNNYFLGVNNPNPGNNANPGNNPNPGPVNNHIEENDFNPSIKKNQTIKAYIAGKSNPNPQNNNQYNNNNNNNVAPMALAMAIPSFVKEYDTNEKFLKEDRRSEKSNAVGIINNVGDNNSFLAVIVQTFWNLELIRNFIIYDLNVKEGDLNFKLLYNLKVSKSKYIY